MKAGFARVCVNPPLGMPMEGLGQKGGCQTIHDDLFVRALYVSQNERRLLILGLDFLFLERSDVDRFRIALKKRLDLTPEQILLNTSHSHAGPRVTHWRYSEGPDPAWLDRIEAGIVQAASEAETCRQEVTVWAGMARTQMPVSRRKLDPSGKARWAPSRSGTICEVLPFCLFKDADGRVVSVLFSVSCHPSIIYSLDISAEYPGVAMRRLNEHFGTQGSLFLQGVGGDTKPRQIAVAEDHWRPGTWDDMEAAGAEVAAAVVSRVNEGLMPVKPALRTHLTTLEWLLEPPPLRSYYEAIAGDAKERNERRHWAEDMLRQLDRTGRLAQRVPVGLHAVQIGKNLRLIGLEGEAVAELGLVMLKVYDRGVTFPMGYTDGARMYLTVSRMRAEGGYEVESYWEYGYPSPLAAEGENLLEDALREMKNSGHILNGET